MKAKRHQFRGIPLEQGLRPNYSEDTAGHCRLTFRGIPLEQGLRLQAKVDGIAETQYSEAFH